MLHTDSYSGLLGTVAAWVRGLELQCMRDGLYLAAAQAFASHYRGVPDLYTTTVEDLQAAFRGSARLAGRSMLGVWEHLAALAFAPGRVELVLPWWWRVAGASRLCQFCATFRFMVV